MLVSDNFHFPAREFTNALLNNLFLYFLGAIAYDFAGVPDDQINTAKKVFEIIGHIIGGSIRSTISAKSNFYELGGNSLNSVLTVAELRGKGFFIEITDFITANCLGDVIDRICKKEVLQDSRRNLSNFKTIPLERQHKQQVIE